jgi:hypothetical protein
MGVQSSTVALMASRGEIGPMPDCGIFADTGSEPKAVYEWITWLEPQLAFPVHRVSAGNLGDDLIAAAAVNNAAGNARCDSPPLFTRGDDDSEGIINRQCTKAYKLDVIRAKVRELIGLGKGARAGNVPLAEQWIGISIDELTRVTESRDAWSVNRWPLLELRMTRQDCKNWMMRNYGKTPPRSACVYCPYHNNAEWRAIKAVPEDWRIAVAVDQSVRTGLPKMNDKMFVHRQRVPLEEADLSAADDPRQISMLDECEGMCGV